MSAIKQAISVVGGQAKLAKAIGVTPQAVSQWVSNMRKIPWVRCQEIEALTKGVVTRSDLRPDIFGQPEKRKRKAVAA